MNMKIVIPIILTIALAAVISYFYIADKKHPTTSPSPLLSQSQSPAATSSPKRNLAEPIAEFKQRITKKPFGIYITPATSPVQPERFTGYHTGVDAEYEDKTADVPVYAIADGKVVLSKTASGYGGVFMIEIQLNGAPHTVLYGHIRPSSLPKVGQQIKKGEQLAILGTGNSSETDGERKHLHFAILSDDRIDLKGYVQNQSELPRWVDPFILY